jgi:hypothetical protein
MALTRAARTPAHRIDSISPIGQSDEGRENLSFSQQLPQRRHKQLQNDQRLGGLQSTAYSVRPAGRSRSIRLPPAVDRDRSKPGIVFRFGLRRTRVWISFFSTRISSESIDGRPRGVLLNIPLRRALGPASWGPVPASAPLVRAKATSPCHRDESSVLLFRAQYSACWRQSTRVLQSDLQVLSEQVPGSERFRA